MTGIYFYPHAKEAKSEKLEHVTFQFMCHPSLRAVLHTNINYIKEKAGHEKNCNSKCSWFASSLVGAKSANSLYKKVHSNHQVILALAL